MPETKTNKERLKEITDGIEQGIKELFESDRYRTYLSVMSRFHRYSVNNTMLIYLQRPDASLVAGFQKWKSQFGRYVKTGERGITIIAPTPFKKKIEEVKRDPDTKAPLLDQDGKEIMEEKEISIPMYKPVKVFDVAQTDGKPLPKLAAALTGSVEQYEVMTEALRRSAPVPISFKAIDAKLDGYFSPTDQAITIREGMSQVQTVCAMIHEVAHSKLHNYEKQQAEASVGKDGAEIVKKDRNTEEVEAESISYAVCQYYGIETGDNSFGYIASWSEGKELKELRASLETINRTASELISAINYHYREICKERGIDLKALSEAEQAEEVPASLEAPIQEAEQAATSLEPEQTASAPEPEPPDEYQLFAANLCNHLDQLHSEGMIGTPFNLTTKEEAVSGIAGLLCSGSFDGVRDVLASAAEQSGVPVPEELSARLEALSDKWDEGLTYKLEAGIMEDGTSYVMAFSGETSHGAIFTGPTKVCENLLAELNEGTMTARQARELNRQWENAGQERPLGEPEMLVLLDKSRILHIQATDEGFDYSLYDADSLKLMDGGQFSAEGAKMHPAETLMEGAFKEVCVLQGLEPEEIEPLPLEKMDEISEPSAPDPALEVHKDEPELPDPAVTMQMMEHYGYMDQDMLPLSKDRALELADRDITIFMLYRDGTEEMAFDAEEIAQHDGLFGVSRDEWELIREEVPPRDVEQRFMDNPQDSFVIYQLRRDAPVDLLFTEMDRLKDAPDRAHYEPIYTGDLTVAGKTGEKLEGLFQTFNINRPGDFCGHSLSVSDIVALKQDGEVSYHYCDSIGFRELPGFNQPENYLKTAEMTLEDDYGMIDGIINNGPRHPTVAELEAQVNTGQSISIMDLANAIKAEEKAVPKAKEERPSILERLKQPLPKQANKTAPHRSAEKEL